MATEVLYPQQIEDRIPDHWGKYLDVPVQWYALITLLDAEIAQVAPDYTVHQVKEKFNGLRYYIEETDIPEDKRDVVDALIRFAEQYSYYI